MKTSLALLVLGACALLGACAEFPGRIHFTTNPEGIITAGVTISPDVVVIMPEK